MIPSKTPIWIVLTILVTLVPGGPAAAQWTNTADTLFCTPDDRELNLEAVAQDADGFLHVIWTRYRFLPYGLLQAGTQHFLLDGSALPSGLYFARLEAGEFVATQKLLLLK